MYDEKMATITLSLPDDLKKKMDELEIINWSSVSRHAFVEQLEDFRQLEKLKRVKEIISKSKFTENDSEEFSKKVKESMRKNLIKKGLI